MRDSKERFVKGHIVPKKWKEILREVNLGKNLSKETVNKMVKGREGYSHTNITKQKISNALKGKIKSKIHRKNLSKALKGRKLTKEWREKVIQGLIGRPVSLETREKIRQKVSGSKCGNWKGGIIRRPSGYVLKWNPSYPNADKKGYVIEHRWVMEQHIGRLLQSHEQVHHINGIKDDNRIKNLMLFNSHKEHMQFDYLIKQCLMSLGEEYLEKLIKEDGLEKKFEEWGMVK